MHVLQRSRLIRVCHNRAYHSSPSQQRARRSPPSQAQRQQYRQAVEQSLDVESLLVLSAVALLERGLKERIERMSLVLV